MKSGYEGNKCKYFGTDGVRGRFGDDTINPSSILKLGWAIGMAIREEGSSNKVLIGKDTRISGYVLESVLEAGFSSAGVDVYLLGPMPTPAIAYLTRALRAGAGIVISASHNLYHDNGVKVFSNQGTKLRDEIEEKIEKYMHQDMKVTDASSLGKARRMVDAPGRYIEFCKSTLGLSRNLKGMKIVLDCANGATYKVAPAVFSELGVDIIEFATKPNGFNINDNCGSTNCEKLAKLVVENKADLGIAFDGDGDRVIMVDDSGSILDGDDLLFIIARRAIGAGVLKGGIVGTVMSNAGLEMAFNQMKIPFNRSKVGDRYVMDALLKNGWFLGGEPSGHIVNFSLTTTGDGIINALQILAALYDDQCSLRTLRSKLFKFPQILENVRIPNINVGKIFMQKMESDLSVQKKIKDAQSKLSKHGRVLIRESGTEPVIRIMVEDESENIVQSVAKELTNIVENFILNLSRKFKSL